MKGQVLARKKIRRKWETEEVRKEIRQWEERERKVKTNEGRKGGGKGREKGKRGGLINAKINEPLGICGTRL